MAKKRILYIDPVGEKPAVQASLRAYLSAAAAPDSAEIEVTSLGQAPPSLETYYYLALIAPELLRRIKLAEREGYDAAIIGCFCDPALDAAKEICERMVVVGVMEAALQIASLLAPRFTILAAQHKSVQDFRDNLGKYGLTGRLASFRSLDIPANDLLNDPALVAQRMREEITWAIEEDQAEAIILGCTLQLGHYQQLQREFGLPVIDAALAGLKVAEHLIAVREACGWYTSKISSYAPVPQGELAAWGLAQHYGVADLF